MNEEDLAALDDVSDGSGLTSGESESDAGPVDAEAATDALMAKKAASAAGSAVSVASEPIGSHILRGAYDDNEAATNEALNAAGQEVGLGSSGMMSLRSKVSGARGSRARKWDKVAGEFVRHELLGGGEEGSDAAQAAAMADADLVTLTPRETAGSRIVSAVGKAEEEARSKESADPHVQAQSAFRTKDVSTSSSSAAAAASNTQQALGSPASRRSKSSRRRSHGRSVALTGSVVAAAIDEGVDEAGGGGGGDTLTKSASGKSGRSRRKKVVSSSSSGTVPEEAEPTKGEAGVPLDELKGDGSVADSSSPRTSGKVAPLTLNDKGGVAAGLDSLTSPRFWEHDREMGAPARRQWLLSLELWVVPMIGAALWLLIPLAMPVMAGKQSPYLFAFAHNGVYSLVTSATAILYYRVALGPRQALGVPASVALTLVTSAFNTTITFFGIQRNVLDSTMLSVANQHRLVTVTVPLISGFVLFGGYLTTLRLWGGAKLTRSDCGLFGTLSTALRFNATVSTGAKDRTAIERSMERDGDAGVAGRDRATLNLWRVTLLGGTFLFVFYFCQLVTFAFTTYGETVQLIISVAFPISAVVISHPSTYIAQLIDEAALSATDVRLQPLAVWVNDLVYSMFLRGLFTQTNNFANFLAFEAVQMVLDTFIFYVRLSDLYIRKAGVANAARHRYGIVVKLYWVSMARRLSLTAYAAAVGIIEAAYNRRFYPFEASDTDAFFTFLLGMLLVEWAWSTIITLAIRKVYKYDVVLTGAAMIANHPMARAVGLLVGVHAIQDAFLALNTFTFA